MQKKPPQHGGLRGILKIEATRSRSGYEPAQLQPCAEKVYTRKAMLEHLLDPQFDDLAAATASEVLAAQATTAGWLESLGSPEYLLQADETEARAARKVFVDTVAVDLTDAQKRQSILTLRTPAAVKHLAGMLSQYDWDFIEQAKELRGYVVAKLLEETKNNDPRIRLRALELTGKLTEVGSFTERVHVTKETITTATLTDRIREKIARLTQIPTTCIEDVTPRQAPEHP